MSFSIGVFDTTGAAVMVPGALTVQPQTWSAIARGGMWDAEVQILGDLPALTGLTSWLAYRIEIVNANGTAVWWGDIVAVEIVATGLRRGVSIENLANRVQVRYSQIQPGGSAIAADTAWADNAASQTRYGIWERRLSPQREMSATEAVNYGATALYSFATPHYTLMPEDGPPMAVLRCTGFWRRLARTYYAQTAGIEENNVSGVAQPVGHGFTSAYVAFTANTDTIHEMQGKFTAFETGRTVKVTDATNAGNNSSFVIANVDDRASIGLVSTNVLFDPANDIDDTNGTLGFLEVDDAFTVAGSTANSGTHQLKTAGSQHVEIRTGFFGGDITGEATGPSITIVRGNSIGITGSLTNEAVNSVTVTVWGKKVYSSFQLAALTWTAAKIEVRMRKVGSPTDDVTIQLVADSSGSPGTVSETVSIAYTAIPTEMGWVTFTLANTTSLASANVYGITLSRAGANHEANYYEVEVDDALSYSRGAVKLYDGAAWQTPSPNVDLVFRVLGATDTGAQITAILQASPWALAMNVETSGVVSNQWRAGELTSLDEIDALLDMGTSASRRLLATATRARTAVVYSKPDSVDINVRWVLRGANVLTDNYGIAVEPGYLPVAQWVRLGEDQDLGPWAALSPVFVERAEYSVSGGWSLEPEGAGNAFDLGVQQG
jgi:hypothetical protein